MRTAWKSGWPSLTTPTARCWPSCRRLARGRKAPGAGHGSAIGYSFNRRTVRLVGLERAVRDDGQRSHPFLAGRADLDQVASGVAQLHRPPFDPLAHVKRYRQWITERTSD